MITNDFAIRFAQEWIHAWNAHDLERILSHYADDFEMFSPIIIKMMGEPSGRLTGKQAVGGYWKKALSLIPDLRFELLNVFAGVDTLVIYYKGHRGYSAESFQFNGEGLVISARAHYAVEGFGRA